ncbi:MAG: oligosaccharide flippase family protein [Candidimonas sp.]|nr:oligosaccharide flippase family protein [Candidimonas sp.]
MTRDILITLATRLALVVAGLLTSIVTARLLGPEGRGVFFYWTTIVAVVVQFGNFGLASSNTYYIGRGEATLGAALALVLWVAITGGVVLTGGLLLFFQVTDAYLLSRPILLVSVLVLIPSSVYYLLAINLFVAVERFGDYNRFEILSRYLGVLLVVLTAWISRDVEIVMAGFAVAVALMCVPLHLRLRAVSGQKEKLELELIRHSLGYAARAYTVGLFGFLVLRINVLFLERAVPVSEIGLWSISAQIIDLIHIVPATLALVLFPRLLRLGKPYNAMIKQLKIIAVVMVGFSGIIVLFGEPVIVLLFGEAFRRSYDILVFGLPGVFSLGLTGVAAQYLAVTGIPIALISAWAVTLCVEIILLYILVPSCGVVGGMVAMSAAYIFLLIAVLALARWKHGENNGF